MSGALGTLPGGGEVRGCAFGSDRLRVRAMTFGAILTHVELPDGRGGWVNVTLGRPDLAAYAERNPNFGAVVGRYANRLAGARFALDGREFRVTANEGPNCLHGGRGFATRNWRLAESAPDRATFAHLSRDGEDGFPGRLELRVTYAVEGATLRVAFAAETDAPTVLSPAQHAYWNLAGEASGGALGHELRIEADAFTPVGEGLIPTGEIRPVAGTPFDFREPRAIGERMDGPDPQLALGGGYDHNWVLRGEGFRRACRLRDPASGRAMEIWTDRPGLQFYAGCRLDGTLGGTSGVAYGRGAGLALETQLFPDGPNQPGFPSGALRPGERFRSVTEFRFSGF